MRLFLGVTIGLVIARPALGQVFLPPAVFEQEALAKVIEAHGSRAKSTSEAIRILAETQAVLEATRHARVMNRLTEAERWYQFRQTTRADRIKNHKTYLDYLKRRIEVRLELVEIREKERDLIRQGVMPARRQPRAVINGRRY